MIPNISMWINRKHGFVNFGIAQGLTRHDYFNAYLEKIEELFGYCKHACDDGKYTLFDCPSWQKRPNQIKAKVGCDVNSGIYSSYNQKRNGKKLKTVSPQ